MLLLSRPTVTLSMYSLIAALNGALQRLTEQKKAFIYSQARVRAEFLRLCNVFMLILYTTAHVLSNASFDFIRNGSVLLKRHLRGTGCESKRSFYMIFADV